MFLISTVFTIYIAFIEHELSGTEGRDRRTVSDRSMPRSPGGAMGRHGEPGHDPAPA